MQKLTRLPITHAEDTQVLKYELRGRYVAHHDFFDPKVRHVCIRLCAFDAVLVCNVMRCDVYELTFCVRAHVSE